jgi:enoyl-CoA hydratase/carnithine racemase
MPADVVETAVDGAVGRLTIRRPRTRNALDVETLEGLVGAARWFDDRPEVRVVTVEGAGPAFSSGVDLDTYAGIVAASREAPRDAIEIAELGRRAVDAVASMRAVTIARVHGYAIGGAAVLVLAATWG